MRDDGSETVGHLVSLWMGICLGFALHGCVGQEPAGADYLEGWKIEVDDATVCTDPTMYPALQTLSCYSDGFWENTKP